MNDSNTTRENETTAADDEMLDGEAVTPDSKADEMSVESQLEAAIAARDANYEQSMRAQAELENFRKRVQKEAEQNRLYQTLSLVRDLLPALDNLQRSIAAAENVQQTDDLIEGVRMVAKQFEDALAAHSILPIEAVANPFDPNMHEAIQQIPSADHPHMTVLDEVERGYVLHDRVIRPSKVIVSSRPPQDDEKPDE